MINRCCDITGFHCHGSQAYKDGKPYYYRYKMIWTLPKFGTYIAARRSGLEVKLNTYPGVTIGIVLRVGRRVFGLRWGKPGQIIEVEK